MKQYISQNTEYQTKTEEDQEENRSYCFLLARKEALKSSCSRIHTILDNHLNSLVSTQR